MDACCGVVGFLQIAGRRGCLDLAPHPFLLSFAFCIIFCLQERLFFASSSVSCFPGVLAAVHLSSLYSVCSSSFRYRNVWDNQKQISMLGIDHNWVKLQTPSSSSIALLLPRCIHVLRIQYEVQKEGEREGRSQDGIQQV